MRYQKTDQDYYHRSNLKKFLRYHKDIDAEPVTSVGERAVRRSFDSMIYFWFKLQYLYRIGLLKEEELYYFKFYMRLAFKDKQYGDYGLWDYIRRYEMQLDQDFIEVADLSDDIFDNKDSFILNLRTHIQKIFGLQN